MTFSGKRYGDWLLGRIEGGRHGYSFYWTHRKGTGLYHVTRMLTAGSGGTYSVLMTDSIRSLGTDTRAVSRMSSMILTHKLAVK